MNTVEQKPLLSHDEEVLYIAKKKRWWMLLTFSLCNAVNAMLWISFSPITALVQAHYARTAFYVNLLSITFMAVSFPVCPLSAYIIDKLGLQTSVVLAAVLNMGGAWIRFGGAHPSLYWVLFAGQTAVAFGQPFVLNAPAKIASIWFKETERTIATTVGALSNVLGIGVGFAIGPLLVNESRDIPTFLLVQACIATVTSLLAILTFRNGPQTFPSLASRIAASKQTTFLRDLKSMLTNVRFLILAFTFGLGLGLFNALTTLLGQIVDPVGYDQNDSGIFGGVLLLAGILASGVVGVIVDKTRKYKIAIVISMLGVTGSLVWFTLCLQPNNFWVLFSACASIGVFGMSILPVALEMAVEFVFPHPEALSTGILMQAGQLFGIIQIVVYNYLEGPPPTYSMVIACWIMVGVAAFCSLVMLINPAKYQRLAAEQEQKQQSSIQTA